MTDTTLEHADIAIVGSGPAGMQAALVTSRAGKKIAVFDDPKPPRNVASRGVHNILGLDGLLPREVREIVFGLTVDESGYVKTDEMNQTNVGGLWAAGEVRQCCSNALDAAADGSNAAKAIIRTWHDKIAVTDSSIS